MTFLFTTPPTTGGSTPAPKIPNAATDHGHVLWSLIRQGSQTAESLRINTEVLAPQSRISDLKLKFYLPIYETQTIRVRSCGKTVVINVYHFNFMALDMTTTAWQHFLEVGDSLYGSKP